MGIDPVLFAFCFYYHFPGNGKNGSDARRSGTCFRSFPSAYPGRCYFAFDGTKYFSGGLLVFIAAGSCFGIPAIVGMPGNIEVMTTRIVTYIYMGNDEGIRDATALAASLMFLANFLLFFMTWMLGRKDYTTISGKSTRPNIVELGKWKWPAFCGVGLYAFIAVILPLGSILLTSLLKSMSRGVTWSNIGFDAWEPVITSSQYMESIWNSVVYGVIAATIGTILSVFIAYLAVKTKVKGRSFPDLLTVIGGGLPRFAVLLRVSLSPWLWLSPSPVISVSIFIRRCGFWSSAIWSNI